MNLFGPMIREDTPTPAPETSLAKKIIDAGRRRRNPDPNEFLPPEGSLARQIIDAGRKARVDDSGPH